MSDWTHKNLEDVSDLFYAFHAVGLKLTKISGHVSSNGESVFLDSSSRDLHLSTKVTDPIELYQKSVATPRYFGLTVSDKILEDLVQEFFIRRKEINLVELMSLFPDFDSIIPQLKLEKVKILLPEVVDKYGKDKALSVKLNPAETDEESSVYASKNNKVTFKKDAAEVVLAWAFELLAEKGDYEWEAIRKGFLGFGVSSVIKQNAGHPFSIYLKPSGGIKKLKLLDPHAEEDEQEMNHESGAIFGLVNLMLRKKFRKNSTVEVPKEGLDYLTLLGFSRDKVEFKLTPGFFDLTLFEKDPSQATDI